MSFVITQRNESAVVLLFMGQRLGSMKLWTCLTLRKQILESADRAKYFQIEAMNQIQIYLCEPEEKKAQRCICNIDHVWFIWCCICKSSLDSLIKMNFDATDGYAGLCLNSPPACWQAANPPLSYQLLLKSRLSFHQAQPLDGNELGIFRAILIRVAVHKTEELIPINIYHIGNIFLFIYIFILH